MPAKDLSSSENFYHIYNCGVEKRTIFNDAQDYEAFEGYLRDYLTPPADPESVKKEFMVNGRKFRGTPHQPKNYFSKIELVGYGLSPDHFHLLLDQKVSGSIESFIRSLCTRYSMYFNKKYARSGSLFQGPYKSVHLEANTQLEPLIRYVHHGTNDYSSYPEYSGKRKTSWVRLISTQTEMNKELDDSEKELIKAAIIEEDFGTLERRDLSNVPTAVTKGRSRVPEVAALFAIYLLLIGVGFRNVNVYASKNIANSTASAPDVLSETTQATPSPELASKTMIQVNSKGAMSVKFRLEPTSTAPVVFEAKDGEIFELVSVNTGWYEAKVSENLTGYIAAESVTLLEQTTTK